MSLKWLPHFENIVQFVQHTCPFSVLVLRSTPNHTYSSNIGIQIITMLDLDTSHQPLPWAHVAIPVVGKGKSKYVINYYASCQHDTNKVPAVFGNLRIDRDECVKARMLTTLKNNAKQSAHGFQGNFLSAVVLVWWPITLRRSSNMHPLWYVMK